MKKLIASPLNYTGGKYKLLPQILPYFPKRINNFVDLFCGGCNVGLNVVANKNIYNDLNSYLINIYKTLKLLDKNFVIDLIYNIIEKYNLSLVSKNGYKYYNCESSNGLSNYNKKYFMKLREDFNLRREENDYYSIMLYVLIVYSFNNQIRFNSSGKFNLPVGKRDFNDRMLKKISSFIDVIKNQNSYFISCDFRNFKTDKLTSDDFVYIDPPYLITCATYNENNSWKEEDELDLLHFLDCLSDKNISFALSNVLTSKSKKNDILLNWIEKNKNRYKLIPLNFDYSNSNYQIKDRKSTTQEVLVVNY